MPATTAHEPASPAPIPRDSESELHLKVFHLKALHDVSRTIYGEADVDAIYRNFLLMTMGSFGTADGLIMALDTTASRVSRFITIGWRGESMERLAWSVRECLSLWQATGQMQKDTLFRELKSVDIDPGCVFPFTLSHGSAGLLALGRKLVDEPYNPDDDELLGILVNNLLLALKNADSLEEIRTLRKDLEERNTRLKAAFRELRSALRKVELLESIKNKLCKFVPATVTRMLESAPDGHTLKARERDASVLFVVMEGGDHIASGEGALKANAALDRCFSIFMDAVYANNGEVNEAAGGGLMILFLSGDERTGAVEAVRTALCIRQDLAELKTSAGGPFRHLVVKMGINSGRALVGAATFEGKTGERCTYTARGATTNVAARIAELAAGDEILVSRPTAERVEEFFEIEPAGRFQVKNVTEEVEVFKVRD